MKTTIYIDKSKVMKRAHDYNSIIDDVTFSEALKLCWDWAKREFFNARQGKSFDYQYLSKQS